MDMYFPGQEKYYSDRDFDLLKYIPTTNMSKIQNGTANFWCSLSSVWRVIKGPNNDWPLALCDYQSIDFAADVLPNDLLYINHVGENELLHKASGHAWYYLSDQTVEDLIVFRNTDSRGVRPREYRYKCEIVFLRWALISNSDHQGVFMQHLTPR